ncbi:MAG: nitroreductase family protein [Chloroflexi bacterium]|nr:nitroreductase family protein [Chloroflexota bacterium]
MDLFEAIKARRAVRKITEGPVLDEDLKTILDAARLAPSNFNAQPWHFLVVRDQEKIRGLAVRVNAEIDSHIAAASSEEARNVWEKGVRFPATHWGTAPALIVVLTQRPFVPGHIVDDQRLMEFNDNIQCVGAAIEHIHLAAVALGYVTCWTTGAIAAAGRGIEEMLAVKAPWYTVALIPIGRSSKVVDPRPRKTLDEIVTFVD